MELVTDYKSEDSIAFGYFDHADYIVSGCIYQCFIMGRGYPRWFSLEIDGQGSIALIKKIEPGLYETYPVDEEVTKLADDTWKYPHKVTKVDMVEIDELTFNYNLMAYRDRNDPPVAHREMDIDEATEAWLGFGGKEIKLINSSYALNIPIKGDATVKYNYLMAGTPHEGRLLFLTEKGLIAVDREGKEGNLLFKDKLELECPYEFNSDVTGLIENYSYERKRLLTLAKIEAGKYIEEIR